MFTTGLRLLRPAYLEEEIASHWPEILQKSRLPQTQAQRVMDAILERIETITPTDHAPWNAEAQTTSPDPNDWPYFALALKENVPIWSNDKKLKDQTKIRVLNTDELAKIIRKNND